MRIERLVESMEQAGLDAFMVASEPNIYYYTGATSGGTLFLALGREPILLVPELNLAIAEDQASECTVISYRSDNFLEKLEQALRDSHKAIGFDYLSLESFNKIRQKFKDIELRAHTDLVWNMRRIKDAYEQGLLRKAGELASAGMRAVRDNLEEGMKEHEVAAEAVYAMMRNGAQDNAFSPIVASGPRSAYPHAGVTDREIRNGDFVKIDIGAVFKGYRSDITRTFIVGDPTQKQTEIYEAVLRAHEAAFSEIKQGAHGKEVDGIARRIIDDLGYGQYFIHSLGHGVGLEVHEPPTLGENSQDILEVGNVVTNEPGIYILGFGGTRIEDTVLITDKGPERLTSFERDLQSMSI